MADEPELDLAVLFRANTPGLAGAVRGILGVRADVHEVLQEAFLRAWRAVEDGRRPSDPKAWIFVLTLNLARDELRRRRRRAPRTDIDEVDELRLQTTEPGPARRLEGAETLAAAREAIHALSGPEKEVFLLRASGELTFTAVAEALSIPVGTAKTRMRAALRELRARLARHAPPTGTPAPDASIETQGEAR